MKNKFKNLKRRDVLIGASVLTGAAVLASCDDKIDGGTPDKPKESTSISKNIIEIKNYFLTVNYIALLII